MERICRLCGKTYDGKGNSYTCYECNEKMAEIKKYQMMDKAADKLRKWLNGFRERQSKNLEVCIEYVRERFLNGTDHFDSLPEIMVAVQLTMQGIIYKTQVQRNGVTVDFVLPSMKIVMEIDGNLYHQDADKMFLRDRRVMYGCDDEWEIIHIAAEIVPGSTWNLRNGIPYIIKARNDQHRFRDCIWDSEYLKRFNYSKVKRGK